MPNIYVMQNDKTLTNTRNSVNYVGENCAEHLMLLTPSFYDGIDVSKCRIVMHFENSVIADRPMVQYSDKYKNEYLVFTTPIDIDLTRRCGKFKFHFNIVGKNLNIKTGSNYIQFVE